MNISQKLGLKISGHKDIPFVDVNLYHDTGLFVDPCLIECCNDAFSQKCNIVISDYFKKLYDVYEKNVRRDIFVHLSHLGERNEARLGYGNGRNGKAKTATGMIETLSGLHCFIRSGWPIERAIDIPLLMPRFAEDCMSDMLMNILYKLFSEYTIEQCRKYGISTAHSVRKHHYWNSEEHCWSIYEGESLVVDGTVILLIPKQYVCRRLHCSTEHFFMSKIAPLIQKRDAVILDGKERKPNKDEVKAFECQKYGSLQAAVLGHMESNPYLLEDYHMDISKRCLGKCLSDNCLDNIVYGKIKAAV